MSCTSKTALEGIDKNSDLLVRIINAVHIVPSKRAIKIALMDCFRETSRVMCMPQPTVEAWSNNTAQRILCLLKTGKILSCGSGKRQCAWNDYGGVRDVVSAVRVNWQHMPQRSRSRSASPSPTVCTRCSYRTGPVRLKYGASELLFRVSDIGVWRPSIEHRGTGTPDIGCIRAILSRSRHWRATQTTTKQTNTQTNKQTNKQTNTQTNKQTNQTNKPTNKPTKHTCMSSKPGHVRNCSKLPEAARSCSKTSTASSKLLHLTCSTVRTKGHQSFLRLGTLFHSSSTEAAPPKLLHRSCSTKHY
jgi:hypothetical protein